MPGTPSQHTVNHFLFPSTIFCTDQPARIETILGSCVSVCLYDTAKCIGGMNHFMLPWWNGQGMPTPKYGDIAIKKLIEKLNSFGCVRENIVAKIFGGAEQHLLGLTTYNIGSQNIAAAESILEEKGISIIAHHIGGNMGRKIFYHTNTNQVFVKTLQTV